MDGRTYTSLSRSRASTPGWSSAPTYSSACPTPSDRARASISSASAPVSGPASTNRASGYFSSTVGIAPTKSCGRLPSCTRAQYSTVGGRPGTRRVPRAGCGATPLTSRYAGPIGSGATTASVNCRSCSVRWSTASAFRRTRRSPSTSTARATRFSVGSIIPCVCSTRGRPSAEASSATGSVTRSRIRWTWTTSAERSMRGAAASSAAEVIPLTSNRGSRWRAWKRRAGTPSTVRGSRRSAGNPSPRATRAAWSPRARSPRHRFRATRVGPPKSWVGVCNVTMCSAFNDVPSRGRANDISRYSSFRPGLSWFSRPSRHPRVPRVPPPSVAGRHRTRERR